jgi:hypothetical protein
MEAALHEAERAGHAARAKGTARVGAGAGGAREPRSAAPLLRKWQRERREAAAETAFEQAFLHAAGVAGQAFADEWGDGEGEDWTIAAARKEEGAPTADAASECPATAAESALRLVADLRAEEERRRAAQLIARHRQLNALQQQWAAAAGGGASRAPSNSGGGATSATDACVVDDLISDIPDLPAAPAPVYPEAAAAERSSGRAGADSGAHSGGASGGSSSEGSAENGGTLPAAAAPASEPSAGEESLASGCEAAGLLGVALPSVPEDGSDDGGSCAAHRLRGSGGSAAGTASSTGASSLSAIVCKARAAASALEAGAGAAASHAPDPVPAGTEEPPTRPQQRQQQGRRQQQQRRGAGRPPLPPAQVGPAAAPLCEDSSDSLSEIMRAAEEVLAQLPEDMRASLARRPGSRALLPAGRGGAAGDQGSGRGSGPSSLGGAAPAAAGLGADGEVVFESLDSDAAAAELAAIAAEAAALMGGRRRSSSSLAGSGASGALRWSSAGSGSVVSSTALSEGAAGMVRELRALEEQLGLKVRGFGEAGAPRASDDG